MAFGENAGIGLDGPVMRNYKASLFRLLIAMLQWNKWVLDRSRQFGGTRKKVGAWRVGTLCAGLLTLHYPLRCARVS
jgi:hypothetical protein